jgi:multidrug efflux system membrane fusion protein
VLDQYKASVVEAEARLGAQNKSLEVYNLNKEFTHVVSPIDGLAGRYMVTKGNLVNQDQTLLTTVQKLDPMYVYFDMDESTRLKIITSLQEGRITLPDNGGMPVQMGLQNEVGYPHDAILTFMNNQINSTTGSITMRAVFKNPKLTPAGKPTGTAEPVKAAAAPESAKPSTMAGPVKAANTTEPAMTSGTAQVKAATEQPLDPFASSVRFDRQFAPGMFVRVRLPMGEPHPALLIIDRAIQSDQDKKFVYVVDADNKVQSRYIRTLALQEDGLRVVEGIKPDEIKPDDWVVVGAIQQVKAQMLVKPDRRTMPTLGVPSEAVPQSPAPQSPAPVNGQAAPHSSPGDSAAKTPDQPKPSSAAAEKPQG